MRYLPFRWRWLLTFASIVLAIGCEALIPPLPVPLPDVPPVVVVDPQPIGRVAWVFVLEETADRTPDMAALLADQWWHSSGVKFRVYDRDVPESRDVIKAAGAITLPAIVLTDASGKVLYRGEMPRTIDGVKSLIARSK